MGETLMDSPLFTLTETAEYLRLSVSTVRRMVEREEIAVVRIGRRIFVEDRELDDLIKRSRVTT